MTRLLSYSELQYTYFNSNAMHIVWGPYVTMDKFTLRSELLEQFIMRAVALRLCRVKYSCVYDFQRENFDSALIALRQFAIL